MGNIITSGESTQPNPVENFKLEIIYIQDQKIQKIQYPEGEHNIQCSINQKEIKEICSSPKTCVRLYFQKNNSETIIWKINNNKSFHAFWEFTSIEKNKDFKLIGLTIKSSYIENDGGELQVPLQLD